MYVCLCMFISYKRKLAPCFKQAVTFFPVLTWQNLAPTVLRLYFETFAYFNALKNNLNNYVVEGSFFFFEITLMR